MIFSCGQTSRPDLYVSPNELEVIAKQIMTA